MKTNVQISKNRLCIHFLLISALALGACHQNPKSVENADINAGADSMALKTESKKTTFTAVMVDNKKDPNCGMPVTAGIADTVHYKGKVYGFCSDECRDAFLKNPDALVKNAELK